MSNKIYIYIYENNIIINTKNLMKDYDYLKSEGILLVICTDNVDMNKLIFANSSYRKKQYLMRNRYSLSPSILKMKYLDVERAEHSRSMTDLKAEKPKSKHKSGWFINFKSSKSEGHGREASKKKEATKSKQLNKSDKVESSSNVPKSPRFIEISKPSGPIENNFKSEGPMGTLSNIVPINIDCETIPINPETPILLEDKADSMIMGISYETPKDSPRSGYIDVLSSPRSCYTSFSPDLMDDDNGLLTFINENSKNIYYIDLNNKSAIDTSFRCDYSNYMYLKIYIENNPLLFIDQFNKLKGIKHEIVNELIDIIKDCEPKNINVDFIKIILNNINHHGRLAYDNVLIENMLELVKLPEHILEDEDNFYLSITNDGMKNIMSEFMIINKRLVD